MADIFLVRHGQNEDNREGILNGHRDLPLTELGRQQAVLVREKLKDKGIQVIYSSPLLRAYETATIIGEALGLTIQVDPNLIERDFGIMTGKPDASILDLPADQVIRTDVVNYFTEAEGSETFPMLHNRAGRVIERVQCEHPNEHVLLIAHGDINKMIQAKYHGWDWMKGLMTPYLDNTGILELRPTLDLVE